MRRLSTATRFQALGGASRLPFVAAPRGAPAGRTAPLPSVVLVAALASSALGQSMAAQAKNVLGDPLECCCREPMTGFYRDGFCRTDGQDHGVHVVCAQVNEEFLEYTRARGNDLSTPTAWFPGLKPGDKWCLCAARWAEAKRAGKAPPVVLAATHARALEYVSLSDLTSHAVDAPRNSGGAPGECGAQAS